MDISRAGRNKDYHSCLGGHRDCGVVWVDYVSSCNNDHPVGRGGDSGSLARRNDPNQIGEEKVVQRIFVDEAQDLCM